MKKSFDNIAKSYRFLETLAFGKRLETVRNSGLIHAGDARQALLIGDGDGRFATKLLRKNAQVHIHSLDASGAMLKTARRRIRQDAPVARCHYAPIQADALRFFYPENSYDFIALNFVLDCLPQNEANRLLQALSHSLKPNGILFYCDFEIPPSPLLKHVSARCAIQLLYFFFNLVTDIKTRSLPNLTWPRTLKLAGRQTWLGGLLTSEIRLKSPAEADDSTWRTYSASH